MMVHRQLEPSWADLDVDKSRFALRGSFATETSPWEQIRRMHPWVCLSSNRIYRWLLLVAEKETENDKEGMAIYRAKWDGDLCSCSWDPDRNDVRQRDRDRLLAIQPST